MSDNPTPKRRIPMWIKVLLGLSLALNLAVIGLAAGAAWRYSKDGSWHGRSAGVAFVSALERSDRRAVLSELRALGGPDRAARGAVMKDILAELRAETFNADALRAMLDTAQSRDASRRAALQATLLQRIETMDRDARLAYADRLEQTLRRGPRKSRRDDR